jgi:hypothetical protein
MADTDMLKGQEAYSLLQKKVRAAMVADSDPRMQTGNEPPGFMIQRTAFTTNPVILGEKSAGLSEAHFMQIADNIAAEVRVEPGNPHARPEDHISEAEIARAKEILAAGFKATVAELKTPGKATVANEAPVQADQKARTTER